MLAALLLWTAAASDPPAAATVAHAEPSTEVRLRLTPRQMLGLAEAASARGDLATAEALYTALERNPDGDIRAQTRFREARQRMKEGRNRDAAVLLRRVLDD